MYPIVQEVLIVMSESKLSFSGFDSNGVLEGSSNQPGGLVIKKKQDKHIFKVPQKSALGLDVLAQEKKKESRNYRHSILDTPSNPGGVSETAIDRLKKSKSDRKDNVFYSSSKKEKDGSRKRERSSRSHDSGYHSHSYHRRSDSERSKSKRNDNRKRYDATPTRKLDSVSTPSRTNWDDDGDSVSSEKWDVHESTRSNRSSRRHDRTPMPTPSYIDNAWASKRSRRDISVRSSANFHDEQSYEDEQKRLDRAWYSMDEGYDENLNPFAGVSEEYEKKKTQEATKSYQRKLSAWRQQKNADVEKWEQNRMLTSGVVIRTDVNEDFDEGGAAKVHLLVHNIMAPFLDGRIMYTRQPEPVIPVRDPTSDIAVLSRKGSALVKEYREQKERIKAQKKEWELAGTKLGDILGIKKPQEEPKEKEEEFNPKKNQRFFDHVNEKSEASSTFAKTKTIKEQRQFLPIYACRDELLGILRENNVVVIVGETGSGKTTQLTQYLYEDGFGEIGMIGCTQPRRVAAMSVAKRVAEERGCKLGEEVGYAIRFEDCTSSSTIIKYMSEGILLRESLKEADLDKYSVIVMDEAHERSLHTDVLFGLLRDVVARRNDLKLIVTSATMNAEKFSDFFGNVPIYNIPGRTFPVDVLFTKNPCEDYVAASVEQCVKIHLMGNPGDILVFMPGQEEIEVSVDFDNHNMN